MNTNKRPIPESEVLKRQIVELQSKLCDAHEALKIGQRRYDIVLGFSDVTVFDYNIKTRKLLTQPADFEIFGIPGVFENGVESIIDSGVIAQRSQEDMRELYRKIDNGALQACATIYATDLSGMERTLLLRLVTIFDSKGEPVYAVGVRKDITNSVLLLNEKKYSDLMTSELTFIYEANVTQNRILRYDPQWAQEVGLGSTNTLSGILGLMCERHIFPDDVEMFSKKQSPSAILAAFENGVRVITFEYRKAVPEIGYMWFEVRVNIVSDETTGDINIRAYVSNIDSKKKNELQAIAERKRYELALSKSAVAYEINVTRNTVNWGHEELRDKFNIIPSASYAESMVPIILNAIHPHDKAEMGALLNRSSLLESYAAGDTNLSCEYRRIGKAEKYNWFRFSLQLFEDPQTHDVLCYIFIEDINEDKEKELVLLYRAQHDLMTGFYNKNVVCEKIDEVLSADEGKHGIHVFFIIDLDRFKLVNDNFGHAFGDAVISQASAKISSLFRSGDILGRIGGDEFVVFMKNVKSEKYALIKAQEICDTVCQVYIHDEIEYRISVSIGIAIYDKHGTTYDQLYRHSDTALYEAKELGRNRYSLYHDEMQKNRTAVNNIDTRQIVETQTFESGISEYIFRILYESQDKSQAIQSVLELIGKYYHVSRVYIFENSEDNSYVCNTFEWCNKNVNSSMERLLKIPYSSLGDYAANFSSEGVFYTSDINTVSSPARDILQEQNVKSMVQFPLLKNGHFAGFIGLDECEFPHYPDSHELNDYRNFANILGVFITEMRATENLEATKNVVLSVINGLASYAYVCSPTDYTVLFANEMVMKFAPRSAVGKRCYEHFWGRTSPCPSCPMKALSESGKQSFSRLSLRPELNKWLKVTTSWVDWIGDKKVCLVDITDVTEYKITEGANEQV